MLVKQSLGVTGTRNDITEAQFDKLKYFFDKCPADYKGIEFHHGDCLGADAQAAEMALEYGMRLICHPPIVKKFRAFVKSEETRTPLDYLARNHQIVQKSNAMVALPKESSEVQRSGTWATIRYAIKSGKTILIIFPDGSMTTENQ